MKIWKQKILPAILAGTLTFTYGAVVDAKSKEDKNNRGHGFHQKIKFKDIDNHWAKRTVELMSALQIIRGYEDYTFRPQNTVTQAEAIVMVVRLLGLENEKVLEANSGLSFGEVPFWAKGSIDLAIKEGLIHKKELQPNRPATRLFVTKMLVNAIGPNWDGYSDKASDYFKDVWNLSKEDQSYLTFAVLQSLIKGYEDKTFRPNKPVTRAEMAVLVEKLKEYKENRGEEINYSIRGTIESIGDETITIMMNGKRKTYEVDDDDVTVYIDGKRSTFSSLKKGMTIVVAIGSDDDDDDELEYIEAKTTDKVVKPPSIGWMKEIQQFKVDMKAKDKKVQISFSSNANDYDAKIEVKTGSKTRVTNGKDAYQELKELLAKAGMDDAKDRFEPVTFVKKAANTYGLEGKIDVDLKLKLGNKEYSVDEVYDFNPVEKIKWESLEKVAQFNIDVVTLKETLKITFEKTGDNTYKAVVENKIGSKVVKKTDVDALAIIKKVASAAVTSSGVVNLEKAVEKIDDLYDLSGIANVQGQIRINSTSYSIDKKINVSPEKAVLGSLQDVKEMKFTFDARNKKVVYHFLNSTDSYDAKIEVIEDGVTKTTTGKDTLAELRALQELFTKSDGNIDLARITNWVDSKYKLEGKTKITGSVKQGSSTYTLDIEKDL